jgi:hypothetical protein
VTANLQTLDELIEMVKRDNEHREAGFEIKIDCGRRLDVSQVSCEFFPLLDYKINQFTAPCFVNPCYELVIRNTLSLM